MTLKDVVICCIFSLSLFGIMIFLFFHVISSLNPIELFKSECEGLGGSYYETQNVSCKVFYSNCASHCVLNGKTYNYYDGSLCAFDCAYENEKVGDIICVC